MIRRNRKSIVFTCDRPGCGAQHVAPSIVFQVAWDDAKSAGWATMRNGKDWLQFCSWVHRPHTDWQLAEMLAANPQPAKATK